MSEELQKRAIELAWRQWTTLGVAGVAPLFEQAIDLEALIAFTPFVAVAEPRLERECIDWCIRIAPSFVSISRLRQILRRMPSRTGEGFDLVKLVIEKSKRHADVSRLSGKSRRPHLEFPSLLQLRSRYVFGVGARADVIAMMAMLPRHDAFRTSAIQPDGYTKQAVATVIDELVDAGVLERLGARPATRYKVLRVAPLHALLAPLPKRVPRWPARFALSASILETWRVYGTRTSYAVELAKVLDRLSPLAAVIDEKPPIAGPSKTVLERLERWSIALLDG
jgi:hypothetical protein